MSSASSPTGSRRRARMRRYSWKRSRGSGGRRRAGLDHLTLTLRILRSPMRRLVDLEGLRSIAALIDSVPADTPQERELQGELASLAAELGQHGLAMERWTRIADRLGEPRDRAR